MKKFKNIIVNYLEELFFISSFLVFIISMFLINIIVGLISMSVILFIIGIYLTFFKRLYLKVKRGEKNK